jgi:hypothetical protein
MLNLTPFKNEIISVVVAASPEKQAKGAVPLALKVEKGPERCKTYVSWFSCVS